MAGIVLDAIAADHLTRDRLPAEDEDEFLQADLIGCTVTGPGGETLGTVASVDPAAPPA